MKRSTVCVFFSRILPSDICISLMCTCPLNELHPPSIFSTHFGYHILHTPRMPTLHHRLECACAIIRFLYFTYLNTSLFLYFSSSEKHFGLNTSLFLATGRCYYGQTSSIKIMYPASSDYFETVITSYGIKHTERMLDADFVFDFRR
jgi:hypothetical protein